MAENDQYEDEYQFADLDSINTEPQEEAEYSEEGLDTRHFLQESNVKRNALIAVGVVFLGLIAYKFLGAIFSEDKKPTTQQASNVPVQAQQPAQPSVVQPAPPQLDQAPSVPPSNQVDKKISSLEVTQQSIRADVSNLSNQMQNMGSSVNDLSTDITQLKQMIASLSSKINEQNSDIAQLRAAAYKKHRKKIASKPARRPEIFYVQALIPGRAWLISSNGTTLTVREGSSIPGYGTVKLIDPHQGRILTSSGKIILFSHSDS